MKKPLLNALNMLFWREGSGKNLIFICERGTKSAQFGETFIQIGHVFLEISANEVTRFVFQSEFEGSRGYITSSH